MWRDGLKTLFPDATVEARPLTAGINWNCVRLLAIVSWEVLATKLATKRTGAL